jgi:hypothetical protein
MGLYTSLKHPETGEEIQFKCGHDYCEWVELGEPVEWTIRPDEPGTGYLLDGVYWGNHGHTKTEDGEYVSADVWVVIKDHVLVAVHDMHAPIEAWYLWYDIPEKPPREWWTEEAWAAHDKMVAEVAAQYQLELDEAGGNPMSVFIAKMMKGPSIMEQILPMTRIEEEEE